MRLVFFFVLLVLIGPHPLAAGAFSPLPHHRISLSFESSGALAHGTSHIVLPADTPLRLFCGPLQLTGLVLEQKGGSTRTVSPNAQNTLVIPAANTEQTLTLSWKLQAATDGTDDNLISAGGITLAGFWHPIADRDMLFSLEAVIPQGFEAISEADSITSETTAQGKRVVFTHVQPLRSLHFAAGPYVVQTQRQGTVTVATYLFREDAALAGEYLTQIADLIERYQQMIGPYPFKRFALVENRLPTGYGMPGFTLIGQSVIRLPFIRDRSLGHEVLHSWFGNSVRVSESGGNWSEGLTTYLADQNFAAEAGQGPAFRKDLLIRYQAFVHAKNAIALNAFQQPGDNQPIQRTLRAVGYDKSAMVFHMLRRHIGETAFKTGLQEFYRQQQNQQAGWPDLEAAFERSSGRDLTHFFRQWLERSDIPGLKMEQSKIDQQNGRALLTFDLVQDSAEPYRLDVPVRITTLRGETRKMLTTDTARKKISLELDSLPTGLTLDDRYDLMRRLDAAERPPTWSHFLGAEEKTVIAPAAETQVYQPLINSLRRAGCRILPEAEVNSSLLGQGSWLFLGNSPLRSRLFADTVKMSRGLILEVRPSPLNSEGVMVLVDSSSMEESEKGAEKLKHYGPYSSLRFDRGKNLEKSTKETANGIVYPLIDKPAGIPMRAMQTFEQIIDDLAASQVVYVGESHTGYDNHLLQLQIIQTLQARKKNLVIGLEMLPRSSQPALDAFVQGRIDEREFIKASRYFEVWGYDYRLYREIFQYARAEKIPLIGLNLDKGITSQVFATGSTAGLTPEQQAQIPHEQDLDMPGYRQRLEAVHKQHDSPHDGGFSAFLQAQALWDEAMAESAAQTLSRYPDRLLVVLAGNGHVEKKNGIPPRVARRIPGIEQRVVTASSSREADGVAADFLLFTQPIELAPAGKLGVLLKEEGQEAVPGRVRISGISPHGKAGEAGLATEDRILSLDGQPVTAIVDIRISLMEKKAGDTVQLEVEREGGRLTVPVELSAMESGMALPAGHPKP